MSRFFFFKMVPLIIYLLDLHTFCKKNKREKITKANKMIEKGKNKKQENGEEMKRKAECKIKRDNL